MTSEITAADGTLYRRINGAWLQLRADGTRRILPDGTHTDPVTGHTTTIVGSALAVADRDGNKSTVM